MKKSILLFSFFTTFIFTLQAQQHTIIEGIILDAETNEVLEKVTIFNQTSTSGTLSNLDGSFKLIVRKFPSTIIFSYVGYENFLLELDSKTEKKLTIKLQKRTFGLPQIEVTDLPKIETLSRKKYSVKDFIFDKNYILLLAYGDIFTRNTLVLKNWEGDILFELKLEDIAAKSLHRGCLGSIHLIGKKYNYEVSLLGEQIQLASKYLNREFEKLIEPCVTSSEEFVYLKKYAVKDQILTYKIFTKKTQDFVNKMMVGDFQNIDRMKDDFKLERQARASMGRGGIPWAQVQAWNNLMYKPIYSPLINFGKELGLFNHTSGFLEFYTLNGNGKRYLPITYHQNKKWDKQVLFDQKTKKAYTIFNTKKGKSIYSIDILDGTIKPILFFECSFVEKIIIYNGHLFYLESGITNDARNRILHRIEL